MSKNCKPNLIFRRPIPKNNNDPTNNTTRIQEESNTDRFAVSIQPEYELDIQTAFEDPVILKWKSAPKGYNESRLNVDSNGYCVVPQGGSGLYTYSINICVYIQLPKQPNVSQGDDGTTAVNIRSISNMVLPYVALEVNDKMIHTMPFSVPLALILLSGLQIIDLDHIPIYLSFSGDVVLHKEDKVCVRFYSGELLQQLYESQQGQGQNQLLTMDKKGIRVRKDPPGEDPSVEDPSGDESDPIDESDPEEPDPEEPEIPKIMFRFGTSPYTSRWSMHKLQAKLPSSADI